MVSEVQWTMIPEAAIICLALNGYMEARSEPPDAELAVAMVVLNRAKRNPWTVCNTVFTPYQFSWTILPPAVNDRPAFDRSKQIAAEAFSTADFTGGSTHYHTVQRPPALHKEAQWPPRWTRSMVKTGTWGKHVFYRSK